MGLVASSSSVSDAGNTRTRAKRSCSTEPIGAFSLKRTVRSSGAETAVMNERNAPYRSFSQLRSKAFTTSAEVSGEPSENTVSSRRATSYSKSSI